MPTRRKFASMAVALVTVLALASCWSPDQDTGLSLVNRDRTANNRSALSGDVELMNKAQNWSAHMAATGVLQHTGGGNRIDTSGITGWCGLAENVGNGASVAAVRNAFMASSPHRTNTLGAWDKVGTGVVQRNGTTWVTEIYKKSC